MRKKLFGFSLMACVGLLSFATVSCGDSAQEYASVRLSRSELELQITDDPFRLTVSASKGYSGEVRWFSSNDSVAYASYGYVYPVGIGQATITAAFGGGYADCLVTVTEGDGDSTTKPRLVISPQSKNLKIGDPAFQIEIVSRVPEDAIITSYTSSNPAVASVDDSGWVSPVSKGNATITVSANNGKQATCAVRVSEEGETAIRDIAVGDNLQYKGSLKIGAPKNQVGWMQTILSEFNSLTKSNISFTVVEFEESNGTSGYDSPKTLPAVWPYASDQTADFHEIKALAPVSADDAQWILTNMGQDAVDAAMLGTNVVGYPFTSDNGSVMFYDSSVVSADEIDTLSKLEAKAKELNREVDITYGNAFYAAGILQTYAAGNSLYKLTPTDTSYTSEGSFSKGDTGLKGAKLLKHFINQTSVYRNAAATPGKVGKKTVLATIVDVSNVAQFKEQMGSAYATAPLPMVDLEEFIYGGQPLRLGSYLGYKFYGVNKSLPATSQKAAADVAKFLCSEYVQAKRFDSYKSKPSLNSLLEYASSESHINSLTEQSKNKGTILLSAIGSEFYSSIGTAYTAIKNLGAPTDDAYKSILAILDSGITKKA